MAPDNPAGDGDAGTVTSSTAPASSTVSAAELPTSGHPPPPPPPPPTAAEPRTSTPPASHLPATSSGPEPADFIPSTSTPTVFATPAAAAPTALTATATTADAPAPAAEAVPGSDLNGTRAVQASPTPVDTEMSNHAHLLGRQAAAPSPSHPPPSSHPTTYRTECDAHGPAAQPTALSAPPPSTIPTTQFASYSTAAVSQPPDAQRASHSNGHNAVTLPSMRTIDALTQQQPQPGAHPHSINGPLQPGSPPGQSYYAHASASATPGYGLHPELSRYPLPHDPRLSGTRGSKKVGHLACYPRQARQDAPSLHDAALLPCCPESCACSCFLANHMQTAGNQATNKDGLSDLQKTTNQGKFAIFITAPTNVYGEITHFKRHYHAILFTFPCSKLPCWMHFCPSTWHSKWSLMPRSVQGFDRPETQDFKLVKPRYDTAMHDHLILNGRLVMGQLCFDGGRGCRC